MWQNLGCGVGFFYAIPFPMHDPPAGGAATVAGLGFSAGAVGTYTQAYVQFALLAVGLAGFVAVDRKHAARAREKAARRAAAKQMRLLRLQV